MPLDLPSSNYFSVSCLIRLLLPCHLGSRRVRILLLASRLKSDWLVQTILWHIPSRLREEFVANVASGVPHLGGGNARPIS